MAGAAFAGLSVDGKRLDLERPRRRLRTRQDGANSRRPGDCRIPIGEQQRGTDRVPHTRSSSLREERRSELPVICRRLPVVSSAQFGDHRQSRRRGRPDDRNRGIALVRDRRRR
jgi:hypothetical protein